MRWLIPFLTVVLTVVVVAPALAQDGAPLVTTRLAPGLAMLVGRGGNIGVVYGPDGTLLVDDQYAPVTPRIREAVAALVGEGGPGAESAGAAAKIRFVLNTHWHGDHTGGNEQLARTGAVVFAHANVRKRMRVDQWNPLREATTPASPPAALPVVTFDEGIRFHLNGHEIDVVHVDPAHTDGDSIVVFREAKVLHLGDTYFNGLYPYIDLASGGSVDGVIAAVDRALGLCGDGTRIIPGHGPLSSPAELRTYRNMLATVRANVKRAIESGHTIDQVIAEAPTRDFDADWGGGFLSPEVFTRIVYASLAAE